jgi:hypothetical protein
MCKGGDSMANEKETNIRVEQKESGITLSTKDPKNGDNIAAAFDEETRQWAITEGEKRGITSEQVLADLAIAISSI